MLQKTINYAVRGGHSMLVRNFGLYKPNQCMSQRLVNLADESRRARKVATPINTIVMFVPQQEAWIVERMGKFYKILEPGLNILLPFVDKVKYVQCLKEIAIDIPKQSAVTSDNVTLNIDGVLFLRIDNPYLASYGVEDPEFAVIQLAQTIMRSELGKIALDRVFREREGLNVSIVESINKASKDWGISCLRYEIRDIKVPQRVLDAMQMQVEAERKKRAAILDSEGVKEAHINAASGRRQAQILVSEAVKQEKINSACGEAEALLAVAQAKAKALEILAKTLSTDNEKNAASLIVAEQYVKAFGELAKVNNTLILPNNVGEVSNAVVQAMAMYKHLSAPPKSGNTKSAENNSSAASNADDIYEYFSDKEEAEKHRDTFHAKDKEK